MRILLLSQWFDREPISSWVSLLNNSVLLERSLVSA